ncbi:uncharacterized protein PV07_05829 [Cladophialophora immunda]|uniref:MARVEL domain-containing protein n=1 Tax=Cladophialophora immunda TaxID=569365 RepID=A0A0D2CIY8_9EURO|nr:uncharacterized protein PV07_05829 [Cladophialophora immunda]KIW30050.1 hypothetical protein PV07_05829 [Cladophialophora immunda]OQV06198.1 Membrane-associating domain-containing protein [Cladophialophora immunda]
MFLSPVLIVRIVQGVLAFIAMALGATVANVLNTHHPSLDVPAGVVFFIFIAVFTLLVTVPYTILTPRYFPVLAHPFAMLAAETTTSIFWLAGFAAMADRLRRSNICRVGACSSATGSVVVGVFEFVLFGITAFFAFSHIFLGGRFSGNKPQNKQGQAQRSWPGAELV